MSIKAGVNLRTEQVYVEMTSNGLTTTSGMDPIAARLLAHSLISAADNIDEYKHNLIKDSREKSV